MTVGEKMDELVKAEKERMLRSFLKKRNLLVDQYVFGQFLPEAFVKQIMES